MAGCMIYTDVNNTDAENQQYRQTIDGIAKEISSGCFKGKKVLLITGSGISSSVPCMQDLMNKLEALIDSCGDAWKRSDVFNSIFTDYRKADDSEKHQMQSRLLTYVQNAYLNREKYVQSQDLAPLSDVWSKFIEWLLQGDSDQCAAASGARTQGIKVHKGIINADPSGNHHLIRELYQQMNAVSITTNFDNLLQKAFQKKQQNFYPILDIQAFDRYYLSDKDDGSFIEIQSRGDVFWLECTGSKSKICPNTHRQCFVPEKNVKVENGKVLCNLCGSEAKIYFAFPGTKEKDAEMSQIINGVWKYLANSISYIIVTGNSMDYDPVLVEFLRELIRKKRTPVLYISRYKEDKNGNGLKGVSEIYKKAATKFLFADYEHTHNIWARSRRTETILEDLLESFQAQKAQHIQRIYTQAEAEKTIKTFDQKVRDLFAKDRDFETLLTELWDSKNVPDVFDIGEINQMRHFSQLGLKTYWLYGDNDEYQDHNRLKHSVGVMLIASYLYFKISPQPNRDELTFLQLAALLHDLGHLPFSHLLEEVFDEFGWIPAGETAAFNHEQHTKRLIDKLVADNAVLRQIMDRIGYSAGELQQIINGEYGKGYLDALINSPIDCDKIEYLFSDSIFMHRGTEEDFRVFIRDYAEDLTANANHFLVMRGNSTRSFLKLIRMRGEMYDQVYLRSGLRYLEACCKLIIRTFMVYACAEPDIFTAVEDLERFPEYFNLSDSKIEKIIGFMEVCLKEIPDNKVCEIYVLEKMAGAIEANSAISGLMKDTVRRCMELILNTKGNDGVAVIEKERILTYEVPSGLDKGVLKQLLKNLYLRFPGVILIDFVESKSSFSFGKRETRRRRSDGTRSATENILIKDICQVKGRVDTEYKCLGDAVEDVNRELNYSNHSYINIYRISDNLFSYMQAEDYVLSELRKEGIIDE